MAMPSPLPPSLAELIAARFRLLSEPMRLRIIDRLRRQEAGVGELAGELGTSQQNVSKHLQTLYAAGVVERRREGNSVIYSLGDAGMVEMCDQVCGGMERHLGDLASTLETIREG